MEINKSVATSVSVTTNLKWILSEAEPETPTNFTREPALDIDLGIAGKWWAFIQS